MEAKEEHAYQYIFFGGRGLFLFFLLYLFFWGLVFSFLFLLFSIIINDMVTARVRKLGWCNEYVRGRCSLDKLLLKVPDLKEHTDFIEELTAKRDKYMHLPLQ